ncbi:hypothetical protein ACH4GK_11790 [Streptomyces rimosus]|uniref:hypothetical protein n=1 Tax=Streptomyces rimosus TaxID=1927 RepID=UPI000A9D197C|nr:hypothetical protein [Streptomyces rimosus]
MKFRHVRMVAAAGVVVVALTGARHSHGGGCGSSHSSSSGGSSTSGSTSGGYEAGTGSSTSSGSTSGGYDGGTSTSGSTTSGSTSGGSTSGYTSGGGSSRSAMGDIKINGCRYNGAGSLKTTVSATNSSSTTKYTYMLTVKFTAPGGKDLGTRHPSIPYVMPGRTDSTDVIQYVPRDAAVSGTYRCSVTDVQRTPLS